ncbi:OsmC family protein [Thalassotalea psychrophila]|uniref:OsmC family protein n=1 Tax=Thalassotalea psychrophila TaxID=3065647 RepID=A0ABY9TTH5_9GAMM|nr:OsmC family protein [Colwelliaceae bacterium SQ149]
MQAKVQWVGEEMFMGTSESGHSILMDANGGNNAVSPLENVLLSLGCCSSVDVVSILEKARQDIRGCVVEIDGTRVETVPKLFSDIHLHFVITGTGVSEKHVARAVSLSADKYCSVALMLNASVNITHDFEIVEA